MIRSVINISGCAIVQDEESCVRRMLESLQRVCTEIVIIDGGSKDVTVDICKEYTDKVYQIPFDNWRDQKNRAIEHCTNEWVLLLDADEYLNNNLANSTQYLVNYATIHEQDIVCIPRLNLEDGKQAGGWPDAQKRLFRNYVRYEGNTIHENPVGKQGILNVQHKVPYQYIIHDKTLEQQKRRNRQYYLFDPSKYTECPQGCEDIYVPRQK